MTGATTGDDDQRTGDPLDGERAAHVDPSGGRADGDESRTPGSQPGTQAAAEDSFAPRHTQEEVHAAFVQALRQPMALSNREAFYHLTGFERVDAARFEPLGELSTELPRMQYRPPHLFDPARREKRGRGRPPKLNPDERADKRRAGHFHRLVRLPSLRAGSSSAPDTDIRHAARALLLIGEDYSPRFYVQALLASLQKPPYPQRTRDWAFRHTDTVGSNVRRVLRRLGVWPLHEFRRRISAK